MTPDPARLSHDVVVAAAARLKRRCYAHQAPRREALRVVSTSVGNMCATDPKKREVGNDVSTL